MRSVCVAGKGTSYVMLRTMHNHTRTQLRLSLALWAAHPMPHAILCVLCGVTVEVHFVLAVSVCMCVCVCVCLSMCVSLVAERKMSAQHLERIYTPPFEEREHVKDWVLCNPRPMSTTATSC